ncbi:MAG TPA: hypothetical protein DCY88_01225 [Cyanobacteria bacterium UBA11372]|nr:hypothetical protein [Cyanobacteria bacterium UBA11372]
MPALIGGVWCCRISKICCCFLGATGREPEAIAGELVFTLADVDLLTAAVSGVYFSAAARMRSTSASPIVLL